MILICCGLCGLRPIVGYCGLRGGIVGCAKELPLKINCYMVMNPTRTSTGDGKVIHIAIILVLVNLCSPKNINLV